MKRKVVKLILFIFGVAVAAFWTVLFFMNMVGFAFGVQPFWEVTVLELVLILSVGLVPMSIAMLMHAKDIKIKKKGFAIFLIVLAIYWLAHSALIITGMIVASLIFGWDTFSFTLPSLR